MRLACCPRSPRAAAAWRGVLGAGAVVALAACSLVSNADEPQCSTTADCVARGAAFADAVCENARCEPKPLVSVHSGPPIAEDAAPPSGPWSCVGNVHWPASTGETIIDEHSFSLTSNGAVIPGLAIKICASSDVTCASPSGTAVSDANGVAKLEVPKGFRGYLDLTTPPAAYLGLLPAIAPYVPPAQSTKKSRTPLGLKFEIAAVAKLLDEAIDPARGYVIAVAEDCDEKPAEGVQIELGDGGEGSSRYYLRGGLPTRDGADTDQSGVAGFGNVAPGIVSVTAKRTSTGDRTASQAVLVRAGTLTVFFLPPTPL